VAAPGGAFASATAASSSASTACRARDARLGLTAVLALLLAAVALANAPPGAATTYYVRPDGGGAAQCDGRRDSAYPGRGRHQACAWRHPFEALPPGGPARIAGGDTLVIAAGSYMMGRGAPGTDGLEKCRADWPWDCHAATIPGGPSPRSPTRIVGAGYDAGCRRPPQLWGTERASTVLDLGASANVELACLDISDHSPCIEFHNGAKREQRCARDAAPYGAWAAAGITAAGAADVRLADLSIHGLAHDGIRAGRVRDWTVERVRLVGNGWDGWSGDLGDGDSSNAGKLVFRDVEIAWNGCGEGYPARTHGACWGEEHGGYGDGLGTGKTGGDWLFDHVDVHHNAQDGIDLLHAAADAHVVFRAVHAEANAGNQLKAGGSVEVENSTIVGSCSALRRNGLDAADLCRAEGNSLSLLLDGSARERIAGNTIDGEGDCLIGLECAGDRCGDASVVVADNRLAGTGRERGGDDKRAPCPLWLGPELHAARVELRGNTMHATRPFRCPPEFKNCSVRE